MNTYINIVVTAENGNTNIYSIVVTKELSSNNNLKNLIVRGYELDKEFNSEELEYNVNVPYETESVVIDAILESKTSTVTGDKEINLKEGLNKVNIVVTAENGNTKTYLIVKYLNMM